MAVNFPDNPTNTQTFTAGNKVYVYNATKGIWKLQSANTSVTSDTAPTNPEDGQLWFNTTNLNLYTYYNDGSSSQWVHVSSNGAASDIDTTGATAGQVLSWSGTAYEWVDQSSGSGNPTVTGVSPANYDGTDATTFTITGTNFDLGTVVDFITSDGTVYRASTTSIVDQANLSAVTPQAFQEADGPLDIKITTNAGITVTAPDMIQTGGAPVWTTPAGTLYENAFADDVTAGDNSYRVEMNVNEQIVATDPDNQLVTYSVVSGSLPPSTTLDGFTGAITGTLPSDIGSDTTYSFVAGATDTTGNLTTRNFNIIVKNEPGIAERYTIDLSNTPGNIGTASTFILPGTWGSPQRGAHFADKGSLLHTMMGVGAYPNTRAGMKTYTLSTPYDVTTASLQYEYEISGSEVTNPRSFHVSEDGVYLTITNGGESQGYTSYTLTTPHDFRTATNVSTYSGFGSQYKAFVDFSLDGTKFVYQSGSALISTATLSTPFDLNTQSADSNTLSISSGSCRGGRFNEDGTQFVLKQNQSDNFLYVYTLTNPYSFYNASAPTTIYTTAGSDGSELSVGQNVLIMDDYANSDGTVKYWTNVVTL